MTPAERAGHAPSGAVKEDRGIGAANVTLSAASGGRRANARRVAVESPDRIRLAVTHYFMGERAPLSKTEFTTKERVESIWR